MSKHCKCCGCGEGNIDTGKKFAVGFWQPDAGKTDCVQCSACGQGKFRVDCAWANAGSCQCCGAGHYKAQNTTGHWTDQCVACQVGFYQPSDCQAQCLKCPSCPAGQVREGCGASAWPVRAVRRRSKPDNGLEGHAQNPGHGPLAGEVLRLPQGSVL